MLGAVFLPFSMSRRYTASPEGLKLLQAAKDRLGLSFAAISRQTGVSTQRISNLFHPKRGQGLSWGNLSQIAQMLGIDANEVVANKGFLEAQKRIQIALISGETTLNLSDLGLESVPASLGELINLTALDLSKNRLTEVPESIYKLSNLTGLSLSQNQLTDVPESLCELRNLTELYLSKNQLRSLPSSFGQLSDLTGLYLFENQLRSLPESLCELDNLLGLSLSQNQLMFLPEELGRLNSLTGLYLSRNQLMEIPESLGRLNNLAYLYLDQNQLRSVPTNLSKLNKLMRLDLSQNQLTKVPSSLGELGNLTRLYLSQNQLTKVPSSLGKLGNLTRLNLSQNRLTSLPKSLGDLSNLTQLNLSQNELTSVPAELGRLSKLTELSLSRNQLTLVPESIGNLTSLMLCSFYHNQLVSVPESLGELSRLTELYLSRNQLTSVPKSLGKLGNLAELDLSQNQLTSVPESLGKLRSLTKLYLDQNQFEVVPPLVASLINLERLDLNDNVLSSLPRFLAELPHLKALLLHDNSALELPNEILGPTYKSINSGAAPARPADILAYYFRVQSELRPLNEAKLILVGFGSVGKTSLVNRLLDNHFDPQSRKTEGIKIRQWPLQLSSDEDITLHVWDFGGQEIMHSTHQFFLTERSLYILVLNGRQGHEDADAEYWLELIHSFGGDSPIIIVLNKIKDHSFDVNRRALQQKFPNIRDFVATDCETGIGLGDLHKIIQRETDRLEDLRVPFPASWIKIKQQLAAMEANYISFEEYRRICGSDGETDFQAQNSLAVHLHNLGIALNYRNDSRLRDTHVLNPHWVTNGIYRLLNAEELIQTCGELEEQHLSDLLDPQQYPIERHGFILSLMRKFELCFPFPEDDRRYLVADLLDKQQPAEAGEFDQAACLNFRYQYSVLPEGLLPRFIVRTHVLSQQLRLRWRTGVILEFEGNRALVKADPQEKFVTVSVDGPVDSRRRLLAVIRADFDRIHSRLKTTPKELVPVPGRPSLLVSYKELCIREQKGRQIFDAVDGDDLVELRVQDLLNGVDLDGSRDCTPRMDRYDRPLRLFYSYAHKDEQLRDQLETHLKILQRQNLIQFWHDRCIPAGSEWADEIDNNLLQADIILLLISADFIASDYCYEKELSLAMQQQKEGKARVVPIILRPADWSNTPFSKLQAFPTNAKPVTTWANRDEAWQNVAHALKAAIEEIKSRR